MGRERGPKNHFFTRRNFLKISGLSGTAAVLASLCNPPLSFALDSYPAQSITWVSPYRVGGGFDLIARGLMPYVTRNLQEAGQGAKGGGVIFKVDIGGDGQRAYSRIYTSKPDGYTIGTFDSAFAVESLRSKLDFDMRKFTYLLRLNSAPRILVTRKNGFAGWDEMLKTAKARELKWGVGVLWRATHAASIIVKEETGIPARFIPFGNTALTMSALMRGDIQVALVAEDSVKALMNAGEIKALAEFSDKSDYPDVPSITDLGFPHLTEVISAHRFLVAPPGLPERIKVSLIAAFKKAINDKGFQDWAQKGGFMVNPLYGDEADRLAKKMIKFFQEDMKPVFKKYEGF